MTESEAARGADRLLWTVLVASVVVAGLTLIATQIAAPTRPDPSLGPVFPRARIPPETRSMGDLLRSMGIGSLTWYACLLSAPLFIWLSRRAPFDRQHWPSSLPIHLLVIAALVVITAWVQHRLSYAGAPYAPGLGDYIRAALLTGSLPFITVAAGAHALEARSRAHDRELDAARARSQLAEARLEALTAQLQPHFLFNSLQAISTLITHDPAAANRMLASLSDLLREVLRRGERREVQLDEELRVLEPYLDISRWRFGDRLTVRIDAPDSVRGALVPFFVLQPLVENALHHGISSRAGTGSITIAAERERDRLFLTVTDDGPGTDSVELRRGIGLPNTKARLEELYGEAYSLELGRRAEGGFQVRIGIPYRELPRQELPA